MRDDVAMRLGIALALGLVACSPRPPATLVWEGSGPPRAEAAIDAVARLREASTRVRRGPWGDAEDRRYDLRAGDVLHIGRGRVHALYPEGMMTGLAIFTPRLDGPDYVAASMKNARENAH